MFCTNCGAKIPDDSVFCDNCGAKVTEDVPAAEVVEQPAFEQQTEPVVQTPVPPAEPKPIKPVKPRKPVKVGPIIAISVGAVALVVVLILGYVMFLSPAAKLKQNLEAGDMAAAYEIYQANFQGEDLNDENLAYLEAAAEKVEADYKAGTISYEEGMAKLGTMRPFNMINRKIDRIAETILTDSAQRVEDQVTAGTLGYEAALQELGQIASYDMEDVYSAVEDAQLNIVSYEAGKIKDQYLTDEISYEEAVALLDKLTDLDIRGASDAVYAAKNAMQSKHAVEETLKSAAAYLADSDYVNAIYAYQSALEQDPSNPVAAEGLESAKNGYLTVILTTSNELLAQRDFNAAIEVLREGSGILGECEQIVNALQNIQNEWVEQIIAAAMEAVAAAEYEAALEMVIAMQERYPDNQRLMETIEMIQNQMPIEMKDLQVTDALDIWYKDEKIRDYFGNTYKGGVFLTYGDYKNTYSVYNLNGQYSTFTGTVIVSTDTRPDRVITCSIYLDDKVVQTWENITAVTRPMDFKIDLSGAKTMKIVMTANAHIDTELYFVNTLINKAAK